MNCLLCNKEFKPDKKKLKYCSDTCKKIALVEAKLFKRWKRMDGKQLTFSEENGFYNEED